MTKKKLLEDITQNPARYYRIPTDVLRDRRFSDPERVSILRAWVAVEDDHATEIGALLSALENRGFHHAAE